MIWENYSRLSLNCYLESDRAVNSRVPTTVRHGSSLHRICPKLLTRVPDVYPSTDAETID